MKNRAANSFQVSKFPSLLLVALTASSLNAQSIRIQGTTTARYIDAKPIGALKSVSIIPLTQDLTLNAWGFGQGLRIYAQVRGRAAAGDSAAIWPQATDNFDLVSAYGEFDRNRTRVRVGRQWKTSSLGFYNYDGASVLYRFNKLLRAEVYGGWSLIPGESDDYGASVIDGVEPFAPDVRRNLYGGELSLHVGQRANVSALYQREIRTDEAALYSERGAINASLRAGIASLDASVQADLASSDVNSARVQLSAPLGRGLSGSIEARRYRPFFDLWTIWGMFNPVGFQESTGHVRWTKTDGSIALHLGGGLRSYEKDQAGVITLPLRDDGWRVVADAQWTPQPTFTLTSSYRRDIGFGASRTDGDVGVRFNFGDDYVALNGLAYQTVRELQVRDGRILGLGTDASFKLNPSARIGWSLAIYRNNNVDPSTEIDWNQKRGLVWVEWAVGSNPDVVKKPIVTRVAERAQ